MQKTSEQYPPHYTLASEPNDRYDKTGAMFCHLLSLIQFVGIPLGGIIGPLILWLAKKDQDPFVDANGKESINFQLSMLIYTIVSAFLMLIVIGFLLFPIVLLVNIIFTIVAGMKAHDGVLYQYPLTIRFIK